MKDMKGIILSATLFIIVILSPMAVLLFATHPPARDYWTEFSVALGYAGLALMGFQLILTARIKWIVRAWGENVIYKMHKIMSLFAVVAIVAHPVILFIADPGKLALLNIFDAPWRARFASLSTYAFLALLVVTLFKDKLNVRYERWHFLHISLAVVAIGSGLLHAFAWGFYLETPLKHQLWIALILLWFTLVVYTRVIRPALSSRKPWVVTSTRRERGNCLTLVMKPEGHAGVRFMPGQFGLLTAFASPFRLTAHPFAFSSSAERYPDVEMSVKQRGDFTEKLGTLSPGDKVFIEGPFGVYTLTESPALHVFIAGGIGITPVMSILRTMADREDSRPVLLIYCVTDWESATFREELIAMTVRSEFTVLFLPEHPTAQWHGETGRIDVECLKQALPAGVENHRYFISGPEEMINEVEKMLSALNVPLENYHADKYSYV